MMGLKAWRGDLVLHYLSNNQIKSKAITNSREKGFYFKTQTHSLLHVLANYICSDKLNADIDLNQVTRYLFEEDGELTQSLEGRKWGQSGGSEVGTQHNRSDLKIQQCPFKRVT